MFACCAVQDAPLVEPVIDDKEPMESTPVAAIMKENAVCPGTGGAVKRVEQPPEFTVSLTKALGQHIGLELDLLDGVNALVMAVDKGTVDDYNATAAPDRQVKAGDRILAVNNVNGNIADVLRALKTTAITVSIEGAKGLRDADWVPGTGRSDAFCVCHPVDKPLCKIETAVQNDTLDPVWNYTGELSGFEKFDDLQFTVWDKDLIADQMLGQATLEWSRLQPNGFKGKLKLTDTGDGIDAYIEVNVQLEQQVSLVVRRPRQFRITVNKKGKPLGLGLNYMPMPVARSLVVLEVLRGAVQDWNDSHQSETVKKDQRIVEVNGFRGSPPELLEKIKAKDVLELTIFDY